MEENQEERRGHAGEDADSKFAYPAGEEPMYRDPEGNLLTPDEFRAHLAYLAEHETEGDREARYRHARETQRRLLGDEAADTLDQDAESRETREDRPHGPRRDSGG